MSGGFDQSGLETALTTLYDSSPSTRALAAEGTAQAFVDNFTGEGATGSHSDLSDLEAPADDHTQYLLLGGRSGQTISDNITITGTLGAGATTVSGLTVNGAANVVGALTVGSGVDNTELLRFNTDRDWRFHTTGSGAGTDLRLQSVAGAKAFYIEDSSGNAFVRFYANGTLGANATHLGYDGGVTYIGGVLNVASIAPAATTLTIAASPGAGFGPDLHIQASDNVGDPRIWLRSNGTTEGASWWYDNSVGTVYHDELWSGGDSVVAHAFRTRTAGTAITAMTITQNGNVSVLRQFQVDNILMGEWPWSTTYHGVWTNGASSNQYLLLQRLSDGHAFLNSITPGSLFLRNSNVDGITIPPGAEITIHRDTYIAGTLRTAYTGARPTVHAQGTRSSSQSSYLNFVTTHAVGIDCDYGNWWPGIVWYARDDNPTKPKMGIYGYADGNGSRMYFGTSNNYGIGITNNAMTIWYNGVCSLANMDAGQGTYSGTVTAGSYVNVSVAFNKTFPSTPRVVATWANNQSDPRIVVQVNYDQITTSGFNARIYNVGTSNHTITTGTFSWIAVST